MQRHRHTVALIAAAAAAAAAVWWYTRGAATPIESAEPARGSADAAESAERAELQALLDRATTLKKTAVDASELVALLTAVPQEVSVAVLPVYCNLLAQLGYCATKLWWHADATATARELVALHRAMRAAHPGYAYRGSTHRLFAEAAEYAGDLASMADAVRDGLALGERLQAREEAMLWVMACKLNCRLGRLDQAQAAVSAAQRAVARADDAAVAARGAAARAENVAVHSAIGIADADLCLLDERYDDAALALEQVAPTEPARAFYKAVLAMQQGTRDLSAEHAVVAWSEDSRNPPSLRLSAAAKAVHVALLRGDDAAAAARLPTLLAMSPIAKGDNDGRSATLAIEVALRGGYRCDAALRDDARAAFAAMLRNWRNAPSLPGGIGFLHFDERATLVANLARLELRLDADRGPHEALQHVLAAHAASLGVPSPRAEEVLSNLLGERHGMLVYVPGSYGSLLLAVDDTRITAHPLAAAQALRDTVDAWHTEVRDALELGSQVALAGRMVAVAEALLPASALERVANWQRLSVSGAGLFRCPSFDLMRIHTGNRTSTLGDELPVEYLGNLVADAVRLPARTHGSVLFAGSLLATRGGTRPARFPPEYATACIDPHRDAGSSTTKLLDDEVTSERVVSNLAGARVVHVVGHGVIDSGPARENVVVFHDDATTGCLRGEHLRNQDLRGVVVVISACDAADAPWRRGGDPLASSVAGAFLAAGARCVLVPTTVVRLENQMRAMAAVHREFATGAPLAEALRAARRAVRGDAARLELLLMQVHGRGL